ncbi:MAG: DUF389 domain-containing protein [Gemmatimonadota bacterium]
MRKIQVQVPPASADRVIELAAQLGAEAPWRSDGRGKDGEARQLVEVTLPNATLGAFVEAVAEEVPEAIFVFAPAGVVVIEPPVDEVQRATRRVQPRSALELVLGSLQSIGSWSGMLTYAALSGIVAAYAVIFDMSFLLVAAMLIAPLGAPAMVAVIGVAVGDWKMIRPGIMRFFIALAVLSLSAVALGLLYGLEISTATMELISSLSVWTGLLAVVGGAAGAEAQVQSDRDSLVTGTATGFLIAVALSPPAAVLGLAVTIGRWDYVGQMAFTLLLTFAGIIVGGTLTLHLNGVGPQTSRMPAGKRSTRGVGLAVAGAILGGLVVFQARQSPNFRKADVSSEATVLVRDAVRSLPGVRLLQASAAFTRGDVLSGSPEALLIAVWIEEGDSGPEAVERVRRAIQAEVTRELEGVRPYVQVVAVPPP